MPEKLAKYCPCCGWRCFRGWCVRHGRICITARLVIRGSYLCVEVQRICERCRCWKANLS